MARAERSAVLLAIPLATGISEVRDTLILCFSSRGRW